MDLTKEIYWKMRANCTSSKHKFRENSFGITWCIVCGNLAIKHYGEPLLIGDQIITTNLK